MRAVLTVRVCDTPTTDATRSATTVARSRRCLLVSRELARRSATSVATEQGLQLVAEVFVHERVNEWVRHVVDEVQVEHENVVRHKMQGK